MKAKKIFTDRDKEIISLVASALGLSALIRDSVPTEEDISLLVAEINKKNWNKGDFHKQNISFLSFFRAAAKINENVYKHVSYDLKCQFPGNFLQRDVNYSK